jgi:hypothetical protein
MRRRHSSDVKILLEVEIGACSEMEAQLEMVAGGIQQWYSSDPVSKNCRVSESRSAIDSTMRNKEIAQARGNKTVSTATIGQGEGINATKLGHVRNGGSANVKQTKNVRMRMNKSAFQQGSVGA